ncbi:MAG: hypothetical protein PHD56_05210 [Anaerostipes sp.]|nr:hypothetical protein [Anaerostipes sp.]
MRTIGLIGGLHSAKILLYSADTLAVAALNLEHAGANSIEKRGGAGKSYHLR